jgi:predicted enzyme related to lactoylglutathione lyase
VNVGEISKLGAVSLNCPDPHALAVFYSALLEKEIAFESADFSAIQLDNLWLTMQRVDDFKPSTWPASDTPSHVHLDFAVANLDAGQAAAVAAGATVAAEQPDPERWRVLIDPVGHPFCLTGLIPD